jgi:hypothetical protein
MKYAGKQLWIDALCIDQVRCFLMLRDIQSIRIARCAVGSALEPDIGPSGL